MFNRPWREECIDPVNTQGIKRILYVFRKISEIEAWAYTPPLIS
jgi:hypothetical protein